MVAARLRRFSCVSVCGCQRGRVVRRRRSVWLRSLSSVIERPEQRESECHGQDLSHTDGHAQETQHLQLLRTTDKRVDLWTTALKRESQTMTDEETLRPGFYYVALTNQHVG